MEYRVEVCLTSLTTLDGESDTMAWTGSGSLTAGESAWSLRYTVKNQEGERNIAKLTFWRNASRAIIRRNEGMMELLPQTTTSVVLAKAAGCDLLGQLYTQELSCQTEEGLPESLLLRYTLQTEQGIDLGSRELFFTLRILSKIA